MRNRSQNSSATSRPVRVDERSDVSGEDKEIRSNDNVGSPKRSVYVILTLFVLVIHGSWAVHYYQFESMPMPLTAEQAGKRGFSEEEAIKHVKALTELGPHPVGSDALNRALQSFELWSLFLFLAMNSRW
ncbi:unnamed protein product [Ilex paraguariensis]|uniref:Uncharacterized protein n=1 Tax=Ilex paraguariensis TaxID=185542 RepID=A0ABC8QTP1_9AQUA